MFPGIDIKIFDNPDFKEDSVRELILSPIFARLGYLPSGDNQIVRSKTLRNPFIRVGTRNHPVTTIPDYTFCIDGKPVFVLDAKGPKENIFSDNHLQQAYSYAIHPEIRCNEFGLSNGREIAVFNTSQTEPLLHIRFEEFESNWSDLEKYLSPKYLASPGLRRFSPDFGLSLKRMGIAQDTELHLLKTRLNVFAKIDDSLMTATANCDFGSGEHCVSFDFHPKLLLSMVSGLPEPLGDRFVEALSRTPFLAAAGLAIEVDVLAKLGEETQGQSEVFIPLIIKEVYASRFNHSEVPNDPNDIPPHVFKLRDSFAIKTEE